MHHTKDVKTGYRRSPWFCHSEFVTVQFYLTDMIQLTTFEKLLVHFLIDFKMKVHVVSDVLWVHTG